MGIIRSTLIIILSIICMSAYSRPTSSAPNAEKSEINKLINERSDEQKKVDPDIEREYYLKAAFLRFISKFIKWPESNTPKTEINICIFGDSPSLNGINSINGRIINNQVLTVRRIIDFNVGKNPGECQLLFVTRLSKDKYSEIVKSYVGVPVVTFGDVEGFAELGGCMNFYIINNKMAIMINLRTMAENKLRLEPEVLQLITIIPSDKDLNFS